MKSLCKILIVVFSLCYAGITQAQKYRTDVFSDRVKTLRVQVMDKWESLPVIQLEGDDWIEISFDLLGATQERLTYTLTHCDADWKKSQLIESEYMNGFQNLYLEDYAISFNTTMEYVNYRLTFPNENIFLKVSGNYVVQIFSEEDTSFPILTACFSVIEPSSTSVSMQVTPLTDKGMNTYYQAVNLEVNYGDEVKTPMQDLKVFVRQNNRLDSEAKLVKPLSIQNKKLIYQHNPDLIFEGGNEYRSFEMITNQYPGLNIESIEYHAPYYHVVLSPSGMRTHSYFYYDDINGRYYIRTLDRTDWDYEADYRFVHFFLPAEQPFKDNVYILGNLFNNILDKRSQMEYSPEDKGYIKTAILKEGYYNFLYVTPTKNGLGSTSLIEGSYFQTGNEYQVYVYFRPMGGRYDRLVDFETLRYK